jgi:phage baseplate assembly protein W
MSGDHAFLGTGWRFPPRFTAGGAEVAVVSGTEDLLESLQILFSTGLGERIMREDYGCDLSTVAFEEIDHALLNDLEARVEHDILRFEPRLALDDLDIAESSEEPGLLLIRLACTIRANNTRFNLVYPYYVREAVVPGP